MMHFNLAKSIVSPTQIQYTVFSGGNPNEYSDFHRVVLNILREFPKDLMQLADPAGFYHWCYRSGSNQGLNLYLLHAELFNAEMILNSAFFKEYSGFFNRDLVKVFLIDSNISNHKEIAQLVSDMTFGYYMMINDPGEENAAFYDENNFFADVHGLIKLIKRDLAQINIVLQEDYGFQIDSFNFQTNPNADELNPFHPTMYSHSNYFLLNQILANDWAKKHQWPKQEDMPMFNKKRATIQLGQATVIDGLSQVVRIGEPAALIEPTYPPMIIIAPFHFPRFRRLRAKPFETRRQKALFKVSQTEQNLDYTFEIEEDTQKILGHELIGQAFSFLTNRLNMLDYAGYLHGQLTYSPIFRMPIVGKSLNMDLSHFENAFTTRKHAIKKIETIGELMRKKMVVPQLKEYLEQRNGQIVFISDLPMEWLRLDRYPICLTHDICRIPEFNFSSLVNNYVHNQRLTFAVGSDILEHTLIIHCASEEDQDMHHYFGGIAAMQKELGFKSIFCKTVDDIEDAVKTLKPHFLIFDCHGDFDDKDLSSFLVIDNKNNVRLTGEEIIARGISAPLVFISACSTMPNYGYVKFLSDAFMQAGAFAVTATFMPIMMHDAAVLILRILSNLKQQENKVIFSNWLAFISHTLRSTLIFETVRKTRSKYNLDKEIADDKVADILLMLMVFDTRESALDELSEYLQEIIPEADVAFENLNHEWLSYTTLGRADLIKFELWLNKHVQINEAV
ncbi:CHAT domain-containing protein [Chryseobacterium sp. CKR4-1]|uniref:CHAT domain-containing protein n=1 Tax=Chryseobacterium sp. CKR4-1 TaxID=3068896 RepID=UPI002796D4E4|nr:CHAT domain-containing protein [Chryseobacterium sp. CKR4-1]MDQ1805015.1 CHAT domain-containing protein [Chryseobacterium sp. CKR4-1]